MYKSELTSGPDSDTSVALCLCPFLSSRTSRLSAQVLAMTHFDLSKPPRHRNGRDQAAKRLVSHVVQSSCPERSANVRHPLNISFSSQVLDLRVLSLRFFRKQHLIVLRWPTGHSVIDSLVRHSDLERLSFRAASVPPVPNVDFGATVPPCTAHEIPVVPPLYRETKNSPDSIELRQSVPFDPPWTPKSGPLPGLPRSNHTLN